MISPLEQHLLDAKAVHPTSEHEVDILRSILRGETGTPAQRNTLKRFLKQCGPKRALMPKVETALCNNGSGIQALTRTSYFKE